MADLTNQDNLTNPNQSTGQNDPLFSDTINPDKTALWSGQTHKTLPPKKRSKPSPQFSKTLLIILSSLLGVVVVGLIIGLILYQPKITLENTLSDTILTVDGTTLPTKSQKLTLGKHNIVLSKAGYIPHILNVDLKPFSRIDINTPLRAIPTAKSLVSESAFAADFSSDGKTFFYLGNGGKTLYKTSVTTDSKGQQITQRVAVTPDVLPAINKVLFAPDFSVALFKKTDSDTGIYDFKRYDLLNQTYTSWGKDIGGVAWSPDSSLLAYYYAPANGERSIITSNKDHTKITRLFDMRTVGVDNTSQDPSGPKLYWSPDSKNIAIVTNGQLYILNVATRILTPIAKDDITDLQFSPDSSHILYTQGNHLEWQEVQTVDALKDKADSNHVGQIKVGPAKKISIDAEASKSVFTTDERQIIILTRENGIKQIDLTNNLKVNPFYLKDDTSQITDLGLSADNSVLYALDKEKLLVIPLDLGKY